MYYFGIAGLVFLGISIIIFLIINKFKLKLTLNKRTIIIIIFLVVLLICSIVFIIINKPKTEKYLSYHQIHNQNQKPKPEPKPEPPAPPPPPPPYFNKFDIVDIKNNKSFSQEEIKI